jgi:hypothetical protein
VNFLTKRTVRVEKGEKEWNGGKAGRGDSWKGTLRGPAVLPEDGGGGGKDWERKGGLEGGRGGGTRKGGEGDWERMRGLERGRRGRGRARRMLKVCSEERDSKSCITKLKSAG